MRILFALPGLHRHDRGAEIAFMAVANELARAGQEVTLIGSGPQRSGESYRYLQAAAIDRKRFEHWPSLPLLRHEYAYEELSFVPALFARYRPGSFDVTVSCSYPYTNWLLRRPALNGARPPHVYVTQNGDWPATDNSAEYRFFNCDGLVCTNPDYYARNRSRWNCRLIPNGVDTKRFSPGSTNRRAFGLPEDRPVILMVSALIASKRVDCAIEAVSRLPNAHLVVAGDGPMRDALSQQAARQLPSRFTLLSLPAARMPELYRSADVFLHMSLEEAFGNVFIEALACGLPVVGHDTDRLRWIVADEGCLVDTTSPKEVARAIDEAARDGASRRDLRVQRAANFSWDRIGAMYLDFLNQIVVASQAPKLHGSPIV